MFTLNETELAVVVGGYTSDGVTESGVMNVEAPTDLTRSRVYGLPPLDPLMPQLTLDE